MLAIGLASVIGAPLALAELRDAAAGAAPAPMPAPTAPLPADAPAAVPQALTPPVPPLVPPAGTSEPATQPLRPNLQRSQTPALSFDQVLDRFEREGVVTPAERQRARLGAVVRPENLPAHRQACREGALSPTECRGVVVRWPGNDALTGPGGLLSDGTYTTAGPGGMPLAPITVPVSALLAGQGGNFSLASVFRITPRPAPLLGNGNRSLLFPLIGSAITTSEFGWRLHPVIGSWLMHAGRDLAAPEGTPVVAALAGRVVSSGLAGGYGLAVEVEHERPLRRTLYGHLSELFVKEGEWVAQGEVIGRVGSTGLSTGPHLHFELRQPANGGWVAVEPGEFDPGRQLLGGSDAIALLMGQLLDTLERPSAAAAGDRTGPG